MQQPEQSPPFTDSEVEALCEVSVALGFIEACAVIRRRYLRDIGSLPTSKPSKLTRKYRAWRRWFQPAATGPHVERPPLTAFDVVKLSLIDPELRPLDCSTPCERAAAAFLALEVEERALKYPNWPALAARDRVARLFEKYGIPFSDYDNTVHGTRGPAAKVLAVILPRPPQNMRHLLSKKASPTA